MRETDDTDRFNNALGKCEGRLTYVELTRYEGSKK